MSTLIQGAGHLGNIAPSTTLYIKFSSSDEAGASTSISSGAVKVYKDASTTEVTTGVTYTTTASVSHINAVDTA